MVTMVTIVTKYGNYGNYGNMVTMVTSLYTARFHNDQHSAFRGTRAVKQYALPLLIRNQRTFQAVTVEHLSQKINCFKTLVTGRMLAREWWEGFRMDIYGMPVP